MSSEKYTVMEQEKIKTLLNKFYEGNTSEEEEALLREYLSDHSVSASSASPEAVYSSLYHSEVPGPSDDFYERLESVTHRKAFLSKGRRMMNYVAAIAALAIFLMGMYFLVNYMRSGEMRDTYDDPAIAMAEVKNILCVVSDNMKAGTEPLGSIRTIKTAPEKMTGLGNINNTVSKSLSNLRYLNQLNNNEINAENK